jgi:hypothetical protein
VLDVEVPEADAGEEGVNPPARREPLSISAYQLLRFLERPRGVLATSGPVSSAIARSALRQERRHLGDRSRAASRGS